MCNLVTYRSIRLVSLLNTSNVSPFILFSYKFLQKEKSQLLKLNKWSEIKRKPKGGDYSGIVSISSPPTESVLLKKVVALYSQRFQICHAAKRSVWYNWNFCPSKSTEKKRKEKHYDLILTQERYNVFYNEISTTRIWFKTT